jgi:intracellular multiplication protein IcmV
MMGIRKFLKKQVDFKQWLDVDSVSRSTRITKNLVKSFLNARQDNPDAYVPKNFEDCLKHYQLSEEDLQKQSRLSAKLVYLYLGCSVGLFFYMFYQFWFSHVGGGIMVFILSIVLFLYGFKEYTKLFQIKHRVLKFKISTCLKELILHKE